MFHVKHLFPEAKPSEQGVEQIVHASPAGQPIKCRPRGPQLFSNEDNIASGFNHLKRIASFLQALSLAAIEGDRILRRK
jgi:hypothetical protein